jgi:hypothetical protein
MNDLLEKVANAPGTDIANDRVFNTQLCEAIENAPDGKLDKEAAASELLILRRLRERSVIRKLMDFKPTTAAELVRIPNEEMPVLLGTLQNDSYGAVSLSMSDTAGQETFWREDFIVRFFVISTPEYYKNTFELLGHPQDTVKNLTEDLLLDLEEQEDRHSWTGFDDIVGAPDSLASGSAMIQHFYFGEFSRDTHVDSQYILSDRKLPRGVFVVNERFVGNFQKLDRSEIGGDLSQDMFLKGGDALKEGVVGGVRHIFTSKNQYVPNNTMYQFTTADYLGVAREFQKPTMFMEKKKRTLFFSMEQIIAIGVINTAGVLKGVFENKPASS